MLRFLALLWILVAAATSTAHAQDTDLAALRANVAALQEAIANLDIALEREAAQNARITNQLNQSDVTLTTRVSFEELRQAQFEVTTARTRNLTLDHRISEQVDKVDAQNEAIVRLTAALNAEGQDTLRGLVQEEALRLQGEIRDGHAEVRDRLEDLRELLQENANLRSEMLAIFQRAITLEAVPGFSAANDGPLIERINSLVDRLANEALDLSNAASAITETNAEATRRRNLLRLRADELLLRSNSRLTDAAIVEARAVVRALAGLLSDRAVPTRLFQDALFALEAQANALSARRATIVTSALAVDNLSNILFGDDRAGDDSLSLSARVDGVRKLLTIQTAELDALDTSMASLRSALLRAQGAREREALFERMDVRLDQSNRARIVAEIVDLPHDVRSVYGARLTEITTAVRVASPRQIAGFLICAALLVMAVVVLRRKVLHDFLQGGATQATEVPLEVLRRNLYWLLPAGLWAIFIQFFAISRDTASALLPLLAIPAAAAVLRDFTAVIVTRQAFRQQKKLARIITRSTEVATVITACVLFAYFILADLPLLPSTQIAINRMVYSVFVVSALPMLLFVFLFFTSAAPEYGTRQTITVRAIIAGLLSLLPPLALIATGVTGLLGYRELASILLEELGTAIAIAAVLVLAVGIMSDVLSGIAARIRERDPSRAYFVQVNVLRPIYRIGQFILIIVAVRVTASIFDWTEETPVISTIVSTWRAVLFSIGGQPYTVGNVALGLLALFLVFWLGAWSRRITYSVVLKNVRDVGIRQSLSTFSQYVVIVIGVLITLSTIGFDVTTLTVFAASLGVGIGFGLQNVVNNFISGIMLLVERPLRIGDIVTVGGNTGTVSHIGIRSMRMRTFDEFDLVVPNSQLISETFTNWTRSNSLMRVVLSVGISYDDPAENAVAIVANILDGHRGVVRNPPPLVTIDEFADSSINLRVCYYVDLMGEMSSFVVRSEILGTIKREFADAGISIPFPQRDVHMIGRPGSTTTELDHAKELVGNEAPKRARRREDPEDAIGRTADDDGADES